MLVVIIPTKNRRALLERALTSVFGQNYSKYRIEIINDGSTDGTREYLNSLTNPRIKITHHEKSRGVNASRNVALRNLSEGEWGVLLDDDEILLPNALAIIAQTIAETPHEIQVLSFNTIMRGADGDYPGGYDFAEGETHYEPSYYALMTGKGWHMYPGGENRPVFKWTLFPKYLSPEDINGFERELWLRLSYDGIRIWYVPPVTILIDTAHTGEHLSHVAGKRNPASFARAHRRIFKKHRAFYADHPALAKTEAKHSLKIALRALNPFLASYFTFEYLRARVRLSFSKQKKES
jgi:glycosyltransferase involved in cell wall biosynthesis